MIANSSIIESGMFRSSLRKRLHHSSEDRIAPQSLGLQLAVGADQEDRGNCLDVIGVGHAGFGPLAEETLLPKDAFLRHKLARSVFLGIQAQADHRETLVLAEPVINALELGNLGDARPAPSRPEIHKDSLTAQVRQLQPPAVERLDIKRRRGLANFELLPAFRRQDSPVERLVALAAGDFGNRELLGRIGNAIGCRINPAEGIGAVREF